MLPRSIKIVIKLLSAFSFVLMVQNILFYYGFVSSMIHTMKDMTNPFGLSIPLIWCIHLTVGFLAGISFNKNRFLLAGSMGLFCSSIITGISFLYFGWRTDIEMLEVLVPLVLGIIPTSKLYTYINKKYPIAPETTETKNHSS